MKYMCWVLRPKGPFINYDLGGLANQTRKCVKFFGSPLRESRENYRSPHLDGLTKEKSEILNKVALSRWSATLTPQAIINEWSLTYLQVIIV